MIGSTIAAIEDILKEKQLQMEILRETLVSAQNSLKNYADKGRTEREFNEGDWVFLKLQPYRRCYVALRKNAKLAQNSMAPFRF